MNTEQQIEQLEIVIRKAVGMCEQNSQAINRLEESVANLIDFANTIIP
jgi:hypothetical protein